MADLGYSRVTIARRVKQVDTTSANTLPVAKKGHLPSIRAQNTNRRKRQDVRQHEGTRDYVRLPNLVEQPLPRGRRRGSTIKLKYNTAQKPKGGKVGAYPNLDKKMVLPDIQDATRTTQGSFDFGQKVTEESHQQDEKGFVGREEEIKICTALNNAVLRDEYDKQADLLLQLGDFHLNAAVSLRHNESFPRAAACYISAIQRSSSETQIKTLKDKMVEVESLAVRFRLGLNPRASIGCVAGRRLSNVGAKMSKNNSTSSPVVNTGYEITNLFLSLVEEMRNDTITMIDTCREKWQELASSEEREESVVCKNKFVASVSNLRNYILGSMKDLFNQLCTEVMEALGPPPGSYAIVGFGDMASGGVTPFSDFEFGILIEHSSASQEIVKYFRAFCHLLEIKIIALGETPLEHSRVRLIHDSFNTSLESFPDLMTQNGIKIDLSPTSRSISPFWLRRSDLIGKNIQRSELIMTPRELADFVVQEDLGKRNPELMLKLCTYCFLSGDQSLYKLFDSHLRSSLMMPTRQGQRRHLAVFLGAAKYLLKGCLVPQKTHFPDPPGLLQPCLLANDITSFHQLLQAIRLSHHIPITSPESLLDQLRAKLVISDEGRSNLLTASAITYLLQVCIVMNQNPMLGNPTFDRSSGGYTVNKGRNIECNARSEKEETSVLYQLVGFDADDMLLRYYTVWYALRDILQGCIQNIRHPLCTTSRLIQHGYAPRAHVEYRQLRIGRAMSAFAEEISYLEQSYVLTKPSVLCELYLEAGMLALEMRQTHDATNYFSRAMEHKDDIEDQELRSKAFLLIWLHFGDCYVIRGKLEKAFRFYNDSLDMYSNMAISSVNREFPAVTYARLGVTCHRLGKFDDALQAFSTSLRYSASSALDESIGVLHLQIAETFLAKADYRKSMGHLTQSSSIMHHIYGPRKWHPIFARIHTIASEIQGLSIKPEFAVNYNTYAHRLASLYLHMIDEMRLLEQDSMSWEVVAQVRAIAQSSSNMEMHHEALELLESIQQKLSVIFLGSIDKVNLLIAVYHVAHCKYRIGAYADCETKIGDVIAQVKTKKRASLPPLCLQGVYKLAGCAASALGKMETAAVYFQKALDILYQVYGKETKHPHVSDIQMEQAHAFWAVNQTDQCLQLMLASLEGRRAFFGLFHPKIASTHEMLGDFMLKLHTQSKENNGEPTPGDNRCDDEKVKSASESSSGRLAIEHFTKALDIFQKIEGSNTGSMNSVRLHTRLGIAYKEIRDFQHAEALLKMACEKAGEVLNLGMTGILGVSNAKSHLGYLYRETRQFYMALDSHKEAFELIRSLPEKPKRQLAEAALDMAKDYYSLSLFTDANRMYICAIDTLRGVLVNDADHITLATWLEDYAAILCITGQERDAVKTYQESLDIKRRILGEDHLDDSALRSLTQLAHIEEKGGNLQRALALRIQVLSNHESSANKGGMKEQVDAISKVCDIYDQLGMYESSLKYQGQIFDKLTSAEDQPSHESCRFIGQCLHKTGQCYTHLGQYKEAVEAYEKSLLFYQKMDDDSVTMNTAVTSYYIGRVHYMSGDSDAAITQLQNAIDMLRQIGREGKDHLVLALYCIAQAYESLPDLEESGSAYTEAHQIMQGSQGQKGDKQMADILLGLGRVEQKLKEYWESMNHLRSAVAMMQELQESGVSKLDLANALNELGCANANVGNFTEAIKNHKHSVHLYRQIYGHETAHMKIAIVYMSSAKTHKMAALTAKAIADATQAISIMELVLGADVVHLDVANMHGLIGDCHLQLDQMSEAHAHYRKMSQMLLDIHNGDILQPAIRDALKKVSFTKKISTNPD